MEDPAPEFRRALVDAAARTSPGWTIDEVVTTKTGTLAVLVDPAGSGLRRLVKHDPRWTIETVRGLAATHGACRADSEARGETPFVAAAHGWGDDPPHLCTDWVEGEDLLGWVRAAWDAAAPGTGPAIVLAAAADAAVALARYHRAVEPTRGPGSEIPLVNASRTEVGAGARLVRLLRGHAIDAAPLVRSFDDPGPHNAVVDDSGGIWLIDLPAHLQEIPRERDLARLASRFVGELQRLTDSRWWPRHDHYRDVLERVCAGYRSVDGGAPPLDEALAVACLASDATLKAVRSWQRRPPGRRLEGLVREGLAAIALSVRTLRLRVAAARR